MVAKVVEAEMKAKGKSEEDEQSSARSQNIGRCLEDRVQNLNYFINPDHFLGSAFRGGGDWKRTIIK